MPEQSAPTPTTQVFAHDGALPSRVPAAVTGRILDAWDTHVHVFDAAAPVQAGHYQPAHRPIERIEAEAAHLGVGHLVLVQPSVYGTDNRVLLHALEQSCGRHRGVVVVDAHITDAALSTMHALGVRGVRFNLVSPLGNSAAALRTLAPRLHALGWHVQWYANADQLALIADLHAQNGLPCVLDHLAGLHAGIPSSDPAWQALAMLASQGAWVKLSGWYRLQSQAPYGTLHANLARVAAMVGDQRLVWGSDWPHTAFAADAMPSYASVWEPVLAVLGAVRSRHVLAGGAPLYR
ncbi:MAG: amidohydrolase family protein [Burkholderiaceae bacterium]|nr:amidohydrolase family protein [Burkholderiaceae bacterium]